MLRNVIVAGICCLVSNLSFADDTLARCRTHEWSEGGERFTAEMAQRMIARDGSADAVVKSLQTGHEADVKALSELNKGDASANQRQADSLNKAHEKFISQLTPLLRCVERK
jgi:hypothetical protein